MREASDEFSRQHVAQGSIRTGCEKEIVVGSGWVVWLESVQLKMKKASEDKRHEKGPCCPSDRNDSQWEENMNT